MHVLDRQIEDAIQASGIQTGVVHVFNVGSTGAIGAIEFEPGLEGDLPEVLDQLIPPSTHYGHEQAWHDGNGHSHLQATLLGQAWSAPVHQGRLATGTWQQVIHLECDNKPRSRTIVVTLIGE
jgi:secondary thiamine-phosphate synthase enzyme